MNVADNVNKQKALFFKQLSWNKWELISYERLPDALGKPYFVLGIN